jgi:hypothetical protein
MRNFAKKKYEAGTACSLLQVSAGIGLTAVTSTPHKNGDVSKYKIYL